MEYIIYHDVNGNVYFFYNEIYYYLTINKDNDLELFEIDISKLDDLSESNNNIIYDKIINLDEETNTLKKRILEQIENDDCSDNEEDYQNFKEKIKYFEEDKYFFSKNGEDNENSNFKFYKIEGDTSILSINKGFDVLSIYDTYIRDNNKNVIASITCNSDDNYYRVSIFKNDEITLNIIGNTTKNFIIEKNNELIIKTKT